uniref:Odorant receptor n=1 Tax=Eogystia hippophaecolus TaxID=1206364 RepID=A0A1B3P5Q8_EOGHI|nr:odorant receptor [Eogystia hippophaecolus]
MKPSLKIDLIQFITLPIKSLKFFGIWVFIPYPITSIGFWIGVLVRFVVGISIFIIPTATQFLYLVTLIMSGNAEISEIAGIINLVLTELLTSVRLLDLRLRRKSLTQLMDQLVNIESHCFVDAHKEILETAMKKSRKLYLWMLFLTIFDITVHVIVVPALQGFQTLPLKMDFIIFDVNDENYFKYICAYQILYKPAMLTTFVALLSLLWSFMMSIIGQLDVLIYNFENMNGLVEAMKAERLCDGNEAFKEIFKRCVLHHHEIIRYLTTFQNAFGGQMLTTLILSATIIGTTALQILSIESPTKNITVIIWVLLFLFITVFILFGDCYYGDIIRVKSSQLATAAFACPWLNKRNQLKKNLLIFIAKCQQPLIVMTPILVPVTIQTFTLVMNWTYKGCAVLNQMKK